jgi:hypothetical protein
MHIINSRGSKYKKSFADGSPYAMKVACAVKARYKPKEKEG